MKDSEVNVYSVFVVLCNIMSISSCGKKGSECNLCINITCIRREEDWNISNECTCKNKTAVF